MSGCGLDAAPYLLGALEPDEARAFVRHLDQCAVCRDEVASLAPVLNALPSYAPPQPVRSAFRRRMLRAVRTEPKAPSSRRRRVSLGPAAPAGWLALGLAVAAAALVVAVGIPHARTRMIQASVGQAALRVDPGGHGELIVHHLPALPADRVYELWLERPGGTPRPSTLFAVSSRGGAAVGVPGDLRDLGRVLVTVEPRGGSLSPTSPPVILERLT
ncbi:MAG TPA: anti-sigma factor [Solirubrobacteraceae bacterium]|nr:anti-sigma factor [Solirubrobacteraceae bacterium]